MSIVSWRHKGLGLRAYRLGFRAYDSSAPIVQTWRGNPECGRITRETSMNAGGSTHFKLAELLAPERKCSRSSPQLPGQILHPQAIATCCFEEFLIHSLSSITASQLQRPVHLRSPQLLLDRHGPLIVKSGVQALNETLHSLRNSLIDMITLTLSNLFNQIQIQGKGVLLYDAHFSPAMREEGGRKNGEHGNPNPCQRQLKKTSGSRCLSHTRNG